MQQIAAAVRRIADSGLKFKTPSEAIVDCAQVDKNPYGGITLRVQQRSGGFATFNFCREGHFPVECLKFLPEESIIFLNELPSAAVFEEVRVREPSFIPREQLPAHYPS